MRKPSEINTDINRALSQAIRLILLAQVAALVAILVLPVVKQAGENWHNYNIAHREP